MSETIRRVSDHPMKKSFDATPSDTALRSDDGWVDMDVRWLLTRETRRRGALGLRDHRLPSGVEARHPSAPERGGVRVPRLRPRNRTRRRRGRRARPRRGRLRAEERLPRVREHGRRAGVHDLGLRGRRQSRRGGIHPLRRRPPRPERARRYRASRGSCPARAARRAGAAPPRRAPRARSAGPR